MGGVVTLSVRKSTGEVKPNLQWTNVMPSWINNIDMVDDTSKYVEELFEAPCTYLSNDHTTAPSEYGIIVVDEITHTVYSANDYSTPFRRGLPSIYKSENEMYQTMMERGMLSLYDGDCIVPDAFDLSSTDTVFEQCRSWFRKEAMPGSRAYYTVHIDMSPWKLVRYHNCRGDRRMYDELCRIGYPLTQDDHVAWEKWFSDHD